MVVSDFPFQSCLVIFSFCKLTSVLRPGKRDLNLRKILQRTVHVLLLHLGGWNGEDGENGEDDEDDEHGEDDEDVHLLCEDSEDVENIKEEDSRKGGDEAYL